MISLIPKDCTDPGISTDVNTFYSLCKTGIKSTAISRLESPNYGKVPFSMLEKIAQALACELQIRLVPKHDNFIEFVNWGCT